MRRKRKTIDLTRRVPRQDRARYTVETIYEATARILQEKGRAALTTNRIAERAGIGISTLYQYFPNKEAILVAMARRELDAHRHAVVAAIAELPADAQMPPERAVVRALINAFANRREMRRIAFETLIALGLGDEMSKPVEEAAAAVNRRRDRFMPGRAEPISPTSLFVLTRAVSGVIGAAARERTSALGTPEFEEEVVRLVRGYVAQLAA